MPSAVRESYQAEGPLSKAGCRYELGTSFRVRNRKERLLRPHYG